MPGLLAAGLSFLVDGSVEGTTACATHCGVLSGVHTLLSFGDCGVLLGAVHFGDFAPQTPSGLPWP